MEELLESIRRDYEDYTQFSSNHKQMVEYFGKETDRSAALLSTSFLDVVLESALRRIFVNDKKVNDLFQGYAPLSSFSAKIDMSFAMGLINKDMLHDITFVRKIRNQFAHSWQDLTFDTAPISDLCSNFLLPKTQLYKYSPNGRLALDPRAKVGDAGYILGNDISLFPRKDQFFRVVLALNISITTIARTWPRRTPTDFDYLGRNDP